MSLSEDFDLPRNVLNNMLQLIEEGNLSKEDVIEHLINNGFLPVEVTDFGRLPITIGIPSIERPRSESEEKFREQITSERLRELSTTSRIPFDEKKIRMRLKSVDINDPDFDFERFDPTNLEVEDFGLNGKNNIRPKPNTKIARQEKNPVKTVTIMSTTEANNQNTTSLIKVDEEEMQKIEAVMAMIRMFEDNQITENELLEMMAQMGDEIIGDANPITEFTMFSDLDMPVKTSFTNMDVPVQERPPMDQSNIVEFPKEALNTVVDPLEFENINAAPVESPGPSIKPFTSFGSKVNENHNNLKSILSGTGPNEPPSGVVTTDPALHHTLFYDDLSGQQINIKMPNSFPDFNSFDLTHEQHGPVYSSEPYKGYLPPPEELPIVIPEQPKSKQHYPPEYYQNTYQNHPNYEEAFYNHHYHEHVSSVIPESPYYTSSLPSKPPALNHHYYHLNEHKQYENVNDRPFQFDEMTHEIFAPHEPTYNGPREPFGPPPSLVPQHSPEFIELPVPESKPPVYVKSLPDYPAYGSYNTEGYNNYQLPAAYQSYNPPVPDSHSYEHHKHIPPPEYIPAEVVHHQPEPEYPSPLYLHHGPGGYDDNTKVPVYIPQDSYYPAPGLEQEYGLRKPRAPILGLPDHITDKPFAYEEPPLSPLTGHREIDKTIEDIHRAFVDGDEMEYKQS